LDLKRRKESGQTNLPAQGFVIKKEEKSFESRWINKECGLKGWIGMHFNENAA